MCRANLAFLCHLGYVMYLENAAGDAATSGNESHRVILIFDTTFIQAVYHERMGSSNP